MPAPPAQFPIPLNAAATAFREAMQITFDAVVSTDGEVRLRIWGRPTNTTDMELLAELDAYEVERFGKAFDDCRKEVEGLQSGGAYLKIVKIG